MRDIGQCPARVTNPGSARPSHREGASAPDQNVLPSDVLGEINRVEAMSQGAHPGSGAALRSNGALR